MTVTAREQAIVFECSGARLCGVLHRPSRPDRRGVVIVVGGPQYRVGKGCHSGPELGVNVIWQTRLSCGQWLADTWIHRPLIGPPHKPARSAPGWIWLLRVRVYPRLIARQRWPFF